MRLEGKATRATLAVFAGPTAPWGEKIAAQEPTRRCGEPAEVAALARLLASAEDSSPTGARIPVAGGKAAKPHVPAP